MADKKPTVKLWSTQEGKLLNFEVSVENNEIIAQRGDEYVKFPGGLTPAEFKKLVTAHNEANDGVKAISDEDLKAEQELADANEKLLDSLK